VSVRPILLLLEFPIDLRLTVASHGWAHLAPWSWDNATGILGRHERIDRTIGTLSIRQQSAAAILIDSEDFRPSAEPEIRRRVRRWLWADWDPAEAVVMLPDHGPFIRRGGGRILRCSSFYEDFVKTVLTINTAWSSTCRMAAALVAELGGGAFPLPETILDYGEGRLRERAKLGFRAATLFTATRRMLDDGIIDRDGEGQPDYDYLIGLPGIGPYAAAHCRVLLHDFSRIPIDSVVTQHLRQRHDTNPVAFAETHARWRAYLALGYRLTRLREKLDAAGLD
jgi:3-methyladenine DNA glycosylase/8-oxoguanine DNA glycosylase